VKNFIASVHGRTPTPCPSPKGPAEGWIALTNGVVGEGRALYRAVVDADLGGIVAKRLADAYHPKRALARGAKPSTSGRDGDVQCGALVTKIIDGRGVMLGLHTPQTAVKIVEEAVPKETSTDKIERALNALLEDQRNNDPTTH
jgi:hypothetical protein